MNRRPDPDPDPDPEAALALVLRNSPLSETYAVDAFVDRLFECGQFDGTAARSFEAALLALVDVPALAAAADRHVFAIYRLVAMQLLCHLNPNDVARVDDLDDDAVIDLKNRFDFVVGCYFGREAFPISPWWLQWGAGRADAASSAFAPEK